MPSVGSETFIYYFTYLDLGSANLIALQAFNSYDDVTLEPRHDSDLSNRACHAAPICLSILTTNFFQKHTATHGVRQRQR